MEAADIEALTELGLGQGTQLLDLELTDLVRQGLTRPDDIAVDLDSDVVLGFTGVLDEEVDRVLP